MYPMKNPITRKDAMVPASIFLISLSSSGFLWDMVFSNTLMYIKALFV